MATTDPAEKTAQAKVKAITPLLEKFREQLAAAHDTLEDMRHLVSSDVSIADEMKRLQKVFCDLWAIRYRSVYAWQYVRESPSLKRLLKGLGATDLEARIHKYIRNDDHFFTKNRHTFGIFVTTVNQHAVESPKGAFALEGGARPVGCRHEPACDDPAACTALRLQQLHDNGQPF